MKATIRLGRIAGVPVGLHWSVLGIAVLLVVGLSAWLPRLFPGQPWGMYLLAAALGAVLFVLSLLAHELAHAVVARRNRVEVEGITLWLLGGVARLRGEALTPGAEFRIAAVGPVTSAVVGAGFGVLAWLAEAGGLAMLGVGVLSYLAWINVLLAVFNLVPAAPLDGGRILRAAVWKWRGDRFTATVWAAWAGRVFGFLLIGLGLVRALAGLGFGLWWILLGLFVVTMASAEEHQARTGAALAGVRVRDVMTPNPDTVHGATTVADFLRDVALLRRHSAFPLLDPVGRVQGLVTLNRLRSVPVERRTTTTLAEIACPRRRSRSPTRTSRCRSCCPGWAAAPTAGRWPSIGVSSSASSHPATSAGRWPCTQSRRRRPGAPTSPIPCGPGDRADFGMEARDMSHRAALIVATITGLALAACGDQPPLRAGTMGTNGQVGPILLRNVYLEAPGDGEYRQGEEGRLRLRLFNEATRDDQLRAVRSAATEDARIRWDSDCDGTFETVETLPLHAGGSVPRSQAYFVELTGFDRTVRAGTTIPVTLTFQHAGEGTIDALVEASGDGDRAPPPSCTRRSE